MIISDSHDNWNIKSEVVETATPEGDFSCHHVNQPPDFEELTRDDVGGAALFRLLGCRGKHGLDVSFQ